MTPLAGQGLDKAQFKLGVMYYYGIGVPQDYETAVKWCTLAAEQGDAEAEIILGFMYRTGLLGVPQDAASSGDENAAEARDTGP